MGAGEIDDVQTQLEGRYRLLGTLGHGGMGDVYLAEHKTLGRREALKILRREFVTSPELFARFRREARAANRVQHRNIVGVYDFGRLGDGRCYLAMEYIEGTEVHDLLRDGPLELWRAVRVLVQLARAIDHAHSRAVVHRDIKPSNLLLTEERGEADVLKVLDFGIAKIIAPDYAESFGVSSGEHIYGTPAFMAPEQIRGDGTDPRMDLYALGCVAMELITGAPPFSGKMMDMLQAHTSEPPPHLGSRVPNVPEQLEQVVAKCLEKDPENRFQRGLEIDRAMAGLPGYFEEGDHLLRVYQSGGQPKLMLPEVVHDDETGQVTVTDPRQTQIIAQQRRRTAIDRAERIVDAGCQDFHLMILLGELSDAESLRDRLVADLEQLAAQDARIEQETRDRVAQLRFAVGELRFERERALRSGDLVSPDVDYQIEQLETRLTTIDDELASSRSRLTDRSLELSGMLAETEDQAAKLHEKLERLLEELEPQFDFTIPEA